jgi:hypothetical protein
MGEDGDAMKRLGTKLSRRQACDLGCLRHDCLGPHPQQLKKGLREPIMCAGRQRTPSRISLDLFRYFTSSWF